MEKIIVACTAHRPDKLNFEYDGGPVSNALKTVLKRYLTEVQATEGISGMALGGDTLFTEACLELNLPVTAAIPCDGQASKWPQRSKDRYYKLLAHPLVTTHLVSPGVPYHPKLMDIRNRWMVDHCTKLVSIWDGTPGGTANCLAYAREVGIDYYRIDPRHFIDEFGK